ncbi:MAG: aldo/keto reductase [Flavobacteriales bacterium]|nr:aldo/keto reductase [Flavobacteriales bacterium]
MQYKLFGKSGLRVSELCLGTMTFGEEWGYGANKEESRTIFNSFLEAGGNFIDTANRYTEGTSEKFIGEFVKESQRRDELVIATKCTLYTQSGRINDSGNHRKSLVQNLEGSLKRLQLDYVDMLYIHAWDFTTAEDEVMRALDDLVRSGKVLYIAVSDTPAWMIARSNAIAELKGWSRFAGMQVEYSLITRDAERDLLPLAKYTDMGVTAWAPLAGGALTGKYLGNNQDPKRLKEGSKRLNEKSMSIAETVVKIANENNCAPAHVALNWVRKNKASVIPIIGARSAKQFQESLHCLNHSISDEQMQELNSVSEIELGFPHDFLKQDGVKTVMYGGLYDKIDRSNLKL